MVVWSVVFNPIKQIQFPSHSLLVITQVNVLVKGTSKRGTIQNIPMPPSLVLEDSAIVTPNGNIKTTKNSVYTVLLDDNTTHKLSPSVDLPTVDPNAASTVWSGIPSCYARTWRDIPQELSQLLTRIRILLFHWHKIKSITLNAWAAGSLPAAAAASLNGSPPPNHSTSSFNG